MDLENSTDLLTPPFATKIAILLRDDLAAWQRLNVTSFLAAGIAAANPELVGEPYRDGDGGVYLPLLGMPVLVFEGEAQALTNARSRAVPRGLRPAIYTKGMFETGYDEANRGVTAHVPCCGAGPGRMAVHGPKNGVDKILKGAHLHP